MHDGWFSKCRIQDYYYYCYKVPLYSKQGNSMFTHQMSKTKYREFIYVWYHMLITIFQWRCCYNRLPVCWSSPWVWCGCDYNALVPTGFCRIQLKDLYKQQEHKTLSCNSSLTTMNGLPPSVSPMYVFFSLWYTKHHNTHLSEAECATSVFARRKFELSNYIFFLPLSNPSLNEGLQCPFFCTLTNGPTSLTSWTLTPICRSI